MSRGASVAATLFALLGVAALQTAPVCAGERFARGVLWRVTASGVDASHIYGTLHGADARLAALPAPVREAFDDAKSLLLEFLADRYAAERFLAAAMLADGQRLSQMIGPADFAQAVEQLRPIGLPRHLVDRLKPWSVLIGLRHPGAIQGSSLAVHLLEQARARGMPFYQIEGIEEQLSTFEAFPMEAQVALLKHSLMHREELRELGHRIVEAYLARDLAALWRVRQAFVERHPEIAAHQALMNERLIHERSDAMALRMQRQLRRGATFVALEALHLYGEKGVLARLEAAGYRAARVF